jgi:predicted AlkP superfamily pyrophosphatase or phosphodiesterase
MQGTKLLDFIETHNGVPLSSTFPSITSAAIPSINFGVPPTTHGILGHVIFFPEYGTLIDTLRMSGYKVRYRDAIASAGIDVRQLLWSEGLPTLLERTHPDLILAEGLPQQIPGTGLGRFYVQRDKVITYQGFIDGFGMANRLINYYQNHPLFMTCYFPEMDMFAHKYGPDSSEYKAGCESFLRQLSVFAQSLPASQAKNTTIMLCSDHGQNLIRKDREITLTQEELTEVKVTLKVPPGHSGRVTHFYTHSPTKRRKLKQWLQERVADRALVFDAKDIDKQKLLPVPTSRKIQQRLGDLLLIGRDGVRLRIAREESYAEIERLLPDEGLIGHHGSLTLDELLTPFLAINAALI